MSPGQIPVLGLALVSAVVDVLTLFGVFQVSPEQKTALMTVASAAFTVAVALYATFGHHMAVTEKKLNGPTR